MRTITRVVVAVAATLVLAAAPVIVASPAAAASASYKLNYAKQPNSKQILLRWNPCRVHTYKVNLAAVPARYRSVVLAETRAAVRTMAAKTGMSWNYEGQTNGVPRAGNAATQRVDVVIAYTTPAKTNYPLYGSTVGYGGASLLGNWRPAGGNNYTTAITKGYLVIDVPQMLRDLRPGFGAGASRGNLLLHELGHVAGLGHTNSGLMNNRLNWRSPKGYAAGDLAGLAKVGRKAGCLAGF